jgi:hypothetical protein
LTLPGDGGDTRSFLLMRRSRHVLAAVVVATALCADRVATAAPQARPQVSQLARAVANKLSASFRRVVPSIRFVEDRRLGRSRVP